eukprot:tig00020904_g15274.t1
MTDAPEPPELVLLDSDGFYDDLFSACMLFSRPERARIVGVTTSPGMMQSEQAARSFRCLLAHVGLRDVPVVCGQDAPLRTDEYLSGKLKRPRRIPEADAYCGAHSVLDEDWGPQARDECARVCEDLNLKRPAGSPEQESARDPSSLLTEIVKRHPRQVTLVCLAPLTTLARWALAGGPVGLLKRVLIMGGALGRGNAGAEMKAERNFYSDPLAAHAFLSALSEAGVEPTLIGEEASGEGLVDKAAREDLVQRGAAAVEGGPEERAAALLPRLAALNKYACIYDALVAGAVLRPEVLREAKETRVRVSLTGGDGGALEECPPEEGDGDGDGEGYRVRFVVEADKEAYREVLESLAGGREGPAAGQAPAKRRRR